MKRFFIAIVLVLLLLMPAISLAVTQGEENYYGIYWDDKLIGYSQFRLARKVRLAGEDFLVFRSRSRFKVGIGNIEDLSFLGETVINSKSLAPSSFSCTQRVDKTVYGMDCIFSSNLVAQRNKFGPQEQGYYKPLKDVSYLYFNNLWGRLDTLVEHYLILARHAEGKDIVIPVYDPILRETGKFHLKFLKKENLKIGKDSFPCKVSMMTDWLDEPLVEIWIDEKNGDIIKIKEAGGSISFIKTTSAVAVKVNTVSGIDLWNERVGFSNVYFQNPEVLKYLKAKIKFKVKGNSVFNREITGFSQKFEGGPSSGYYEGTVEIKTSYYNGEGAFSFPIKSQNLTDELKPYLSPQPTVESDSTMIISKATELTWKAINALEASQRICKWVSENIKTGLSLPSAKLVLETGEGNSESKALLVLALCRAAGIPARMVGGVVFQNGNFIPHHWVEAYIGKDIWIGLDPTTGEAKRLDASHIALLERGELQSFSIDIEEYDPHPQPRVSFFRKELTWPIGQERVYLIKSKGEVMAREVAKIKELAMYKGEESYLLEDETEFKDPNNPYKLKSSLYVTTEGLPLGFKATTILKEKEISQSFDFEKYGFLQTFEKDGKTLTRQIPCPNGAYIADRQIMAHLALVMGQLPSYKKGMKYEFQIFIPEDLNYKMIQVNVKEEEVLIFGSEDFDTFKCETSNGMTFWVTRQGKVIKMAIPNRDIEVELEVQNKDID